MLIVNDCHSALRFFKTSIFKTGLGKTGRGAAAAGLLVLAWSEAAHAAAIIDPVGFGPATGSSWLGGAVAGYNWQRGSFVFGFEGDISWAHLKSDTSGTFSSPFTTTFVYPSGTVSANIDWYGTARARLGWANGSFLVYGTGGLAYGNVGVTSTYDLGTAGQTSGIAPLTSQTSGVRTGWVAGVGVDHLLTPNLVLNFEYQYVDLGTVNLAAVSAPSPLQRLSSPSASAQARFQTVTIGLSYKFPPPSGPNAAFASTKGHAAAPLPPSNPWEGFYVGGRTGGAWGNDLNVKPNPALTAG
jgi:outer membrane immunogenic protein